MNVRSHRSSGQTLRMSMVLLWVLSSCGVTAQTPFTEEGQVIAYLWDERVLAEVEINPFNSAIQMQSLSGPHSVILDALGYRKSARLIYGLGREDRFLYQIDASGTLTQIGAPSIPVAFEYQAGDISDDGRTYYVVGSFGNMDRWLYVIDLQSANLPYTEIAMTGMTWLQDIAVDPSDPMQIYGYDAALRSLVRINAATFSITGLTVIDDDYEVQSVYFDAFGSLFALGTSTFGVAGAIFRVDKNTGELTAISSGPVYRVADLASIPYSVEMQNAPSARFAVPCNDIQHTFTVVNRTGQTFTGLDFEARFPPGFEVIGVQSNPFGGNATTPLPHVCRISGLQLPAGTGQLLINVKVGDVPEGKYYSQGRLIKLPGRYGEIVFSDDPLTVPIEDSTFIQVNNVDEDSIQLTRFLCLGESLELDGGEFGNQLQWADGSTEQILEVTSGGIYQLEVLGGCNPLIVAYTVIAASCPYVIEMDHLILPDSILPCSEAIFRFTIENGSGEARENILFTDTLPEGFKFIEMVSNPFGGSVIEESDVRFITLEKMKLPVGRFDLDVRVWVGDVPPGAYGNQAILHNFPTEIGPRRRSDYPETPELDSTYLTVIGVPTDSLYVSEIICRESSVVLDGSPFGREFIWFNGSEASEVEVFRPGVYELVVLDGCHPSYIFFDVSSGLDIEVTFDTMAHMIHLGDSVILRSRIANEGAFLDLYWHDPFDTTLLCGTCPEALVFPRMNTEYRIYAINEHCADSADVFVYVDHTRFLFVPNAFTPNEDGINDILGISSPDYGKVMTFEIYDRWGTKIFHTRNLVLNEKGTGWNGEARGKPAPAGVYLWHARITFLDGRTESFAGSVLLVR